MGLARYTRKLNSRSEGGRCRAYAELEVGKAGEEELRATGGRMWGARGKQKSYSGYSARPNPNSVMGARTGTDGTRQ